MLSSGKIKQVYWNTQAQVMRCQSLIPTLSLSPKLELIVARARQGPLISCLSIYLLFTWLSWLASFLQFRMMLHANLVRIEDLVPNSNWTAGLQAARIEPIQWAPPPTTDETAMLYSPAAGIPRVIHRMWQHHDSEAQSPEDWNNATVSCRDQNPGYKQYLWTFDTAHQFISTHFPWYLQTYTNHLLPVQRVDALRYFLLWHYGGVFLDQQIGCRQSLEPLLLLDTDKNQTQAREQAWAILPQNWPYGVTNELIASTPRHPFMIKLALTSHEHHWSAMPAYFMAFFNLGPVLVSRVLAAWFRSVGSGAQASLSILPSTLYDDEREQSFFLRFEGQIPHGDEVAISLHIFGNWLGWFGAAVSLIAMAFVTFGVRSEPKRRQRCDGRHIP